MNIFSILALLSSSLAITVVNKAKSSENAKDYGYDMGGNYTQ